VVLFTFFARPIAILHLLIEHGSIRGMVRCCCQSSKPIHLLCRVHFILLGIFDWKWREGPGQLVVAFAPRPISPVKSWKDQENKV